MTFIWTWVPHMYFGVAVVLFLLLAEYDLWLVRQQKLEHQRALNMAHLPHIDSIWARFRESALIAVMWGPFLVIIVCFIATCWWPQKWFQ